MFLFVATCRSSTRHTSSGSHQTKTCKILRQLKMYSISVTQEPPIHFTSFTLKISMTFQNLCFIREIVTLTNKLLFLSNQGCVYFLNVVFNNSKGWKDKSFKIPEGWYSIYKPYIINDGLVVSSIMRLLDFHA